MSGLCLVGAAGCGSSDHAAGPDAGPSRVVPLERACPSVHAAYDALVAADPASARVFEDAVRRISEVGVDETRAALAPVLAAAGELGSADRAAFPAARDDVFAAISRLSATCATYGVPILHPGH